MQRPELISRKLKLRHLSVLQAVIEQGSMAKAAEWLAISQPVVSKAIADLEHTLGFQLLERGRRGVEPTIYGRRLLERSRSVFDELRSTVDELGSLADPATGEVRVGSTEAMASSLLPMIIDLMARRYPRIVFDVIVAEPVTLVQRELRERRVDLVIGRFGGAQVPDDLAAVVLQSDRLRVVAGSESPWARRRKVTLADLLDERWCLPPPSHPIGRIVNDAFRRAGLASPAAAVTVGSAAFTGYLVASNQFIGVLGTVFLSVHGAAHRLKALPVNLLTITQSISIITSRARGLSPAATKFVDCAIEVTKAAAYR